MSATGFVQLLPAEQMLSYLIAYRKKAGRRHSWGEVCRVIERTGHPYAELITPQKLDHWEKGRTVLDERLLAVVQLFMMSQDFIDVIPLPQPTGHDLEQVTAYAHGLCQHYQYDFAVPPPDKLAFFNKLSGLWMSDPKSKPLIDTGDRFTLPTSYVLIERVGTNDFCVLHTLIFDVMGSAFSDMVLVSGVLFIDKAYRFHLHGFDHKNHLPIVNSYDYEPNAMSTMRKLATFYAQGNPDMTPKEKSELIYSDYNQIGLTCEKQTSRLTKVNQTPSQADIRDADNYFRTELEKDVFILPMIAQRVFDKIYWNVIPKHE